MRGLARWLGAIAAVIGVQLLAWLGAPLWSAAPALGAVVSFGLVAAGVIAVGAAARTGWTLRHLAWLALPALLIGAASTAGAGSIAVAAAVAAGLLAGGSLVGGIVGARIEHPSHVMVVAYVSAVADAFSVLSPAGPSAQVVQSERLLALLAISWPAPGTGEPVPVLGLGDVILCAIYLVAARRLGLPVARTAAALGAGFAAVLAALFVLDTPLPALPFLGVAMVAAHPSTLRLRREERWKAFVGMGAITVLFAALWLVR